MHTYIIGNWKMNGLPASVESLAVPVARHAAGLAASKKVVLCPPAGLLAAVAATGVATGGQDCSEHREGAYTGDVSADLVKALGGQYVIVGHSERRQYHAETSALVAKKAKAALEAGITPVICVGETQQERDAGQQGAVISRQVAESVPAGAGAQILVAYEPVWAIGTGRTAGAGDIAEMHALLRSLLQHTPLLYGGSVKPAGAAEIFRTANVNGVLVGGASLNVKDFCAIIDAA